VRGQRRREALRQRRLLRLPRRRARARRHRLPRRRAPPLLSRNSRYFGVRLQSAPRQQLPVVLATMPAACMHLVDTSASARSSGRSGRQLRYLGCGVDGGVACA
jgi:hypothetical protein